MAITAGITGPIAPRVHFDEPARVAAGIFALIVVVVLMTCCAHALRPRQGFHYGPDASHLLDLLDMYSEVQVALSMADSFTEARNLNVTYLATSRTGISGPFARSSLTSRPRVLSVRGWQRSPDDREEVDPDDAVAWLASLGTLWRETSDEGRRRLALATFEHITVLSGPGVVPIASSAWK